jgi:hypothetical protein
MPAPTEATYSAAALVAAQTALLALIDAGSGAGKIRVFDSSDTLLAEAILDDPAGTVDGAGQLTLSVATQETSAPASGTAAWAALTDSDDTAVLSLPCSQGPVAEDGYLVLNTLSITAGGPVTVVTATIG